MSPLQIGCLNNNCSCTPDCSCTPGCWSGICAMFEKLGQELRTLWRKMTGQDTEDVEEDGRKCWEFHEDCELLRTFMLNPDLRKKDIFEMVSLSLGRWDAHQVRCRWYKYVRGDEQYLKLIMEHISFNINDLDFL